LQISTAPVAGGVKKCPIQNLYKWAREGDININDDLGRDLEDPEIIDMLGVSRAGGAPYYDGLRDCDFRYITGESIFPMTGTVPLLKATDYKQFMKISENLTSPLIKTTDSSGKPIFTIDQTKGDKWAKCARSAILQKTYKVGAVDETRDALFEIVDKSTLGITTTVDVGTAALSAATTATSTANMKKIAITVNNNTAWVIGGEFARDIMRKSFDAFDIMFNEKQHWMIFVIKKNTFATNDGKTTLMNMFKAQFPTALTTTGVITKAFDNLQLNDLKEDIQISIKLTPKTAADKIAAIRPTTLSKDEFSIGKLEGDDFGTKLKEKLDKLTW